MEMRNIFKIALVVIATSVFFTACSNKPIQQNVEKPKSKIKTIDTVLDDLFIYDTNQKLYKNKSTKVEDSGELSSTFENFCLEKKGKFIPVEYYINQDYIKKYSQQKANVCEINNSAYFITHEANETSNVYYSLSYDQEIKKAYVDYKYNQQLEAIKINKENAQKSIKEREEIKRREIVREQKSKLLFNKKGQRIMTFFDSAKDLKNKSQCSKRCNDINMSSNGYRTLQEATTDSWQLISKVDEIDEAISDSCTCSGYSVLLKK